MVNVMEAKAHLAPSTKMQVNWSDPSHPLDMVWEDCGTWDEFLEANQFSFDADELEDMIQVLVSGRAYHGGGGAAAEYGLRVAP